MNEKPKDQDKAKSAQPTQPAVEKVGEEFQGKGPETPSHQNPPQRQQKETAKEIGGPKGPEPTRYGDWERKGRCIDF